MISLVVAMDEKNGIGYNSKLPWYFPEDLKHFKNLTINHKILMGKTTFESLKTPLKDRFTYIVTKNNDYICNYKNTKVINDLDCLLKQFINNKEILYVCGGESIYKQTISYCDELWITYIKGVYNVDTYFPQIDYSKYSIVTKKEYEDFEIVCYQKKQ